MNAQTAEPFFDTDPVLYLCPVCSQPVPVALMVGNEALCTRCMTSFTVTPAEIAEKQSRDRMPAPL